MKGELEQQIWKILREYEQDEFSRPSKYSKRIASLIEQKPDCYPKEFVEWLIKGYHIEFHNWGADKVYDYWLKKIKEK